MAYFTKVRLHYRAEDGKTKIAPANSIIFDMDDALIEGALAQDYIRPATEGERSALAQFVALHNLVWKDRHASLQEARLGERFEPRQHERGTLLGDHITETWLPGLRNAAGVLRRKPLVRT